MFQALADPKRRMLVAILREGEQPVGQLVQRVSIAQSGVSRHLRILREAGLVTMRPQGQQRLYALRPDAWAQLSDWLDAYRFLWEKRLDRFEEQLSISLEKDDTP